LSNPTCTTEHPPAFTTMMTRRHCASRSPVPRALHLSCLFVWVLSVWYLTTGYTHIFYFDFFLSDLGSALLVQHRGAQCFRAHAEYLTWNLPIALKLI
jgi:hypothetical protein